MIDRVSANPGRVLITPESGEPYYATLTRADNPTVEGTPLNKSTFLTDATAALFGLGGEAVPDDIFVLLKNTDDKLENLFPVFGAYEGNGEESRTISLGFTPNAVLLMYSWGEMYTVAEQNYLKDCIIGGLAFPNDPAARGNAISVKIVNNGFEVHYQEDSPSPSFEVHSNRDGFPYRYIAFH